MAAISNRYEFIMLFDVENGNPNGDPDAGNMPRVDVETSHGIVTDVCIKRKIRNFVEIVKENEEKYKEGYNIVIKPDKSLEAKFKAVYEELDLGKSKKGEHPEKELQARDFMCKNYYDVRTFGAVMSTGDYSCGIVRGPVQINFARSIDPISVQDVTITRQARANDKRQESGETEMGRKSIVPYGLYKAEGYVSAMLAQKVTGFSEDDLELLWRAIINMFENDRSAARGKMSLRKLYVFKHDSVLGNAPANVLFDKLEIKKKDDVMVPRCFNDYVITIDKNMPEGVELIEKI
jgi:CRISPR-associated protein Csd2